MQRLFWGGSALLGSTLAVHGDKGSLSAMRCLQPNSFTCNQRYLQSFPNLPQNGIQSCPQGAWHPKDLPIAPSTELETQVIFWVQFQSRSSTPTIP